MEPRPLDGLHPLHRAAREGRADEVLRAVDRGTPVDLRAGPVGDDKVSSREGCTLLHLAAEGGQAELCARLIARGAEVDARNLRGETPLHLASGRPGATAAVGTLLGEGADPRAVDLDGRGALHRAAAHGDEAMLVVLLRRGAAPAADHRGWTPLHVAAWREQLGACRRLLAAGCDRDARTTDGRTARQLAASRDRPDLDDLLRMPPPS